MPTGYTERHRCFIFSLDVPGERHCLAGILTFCGHRSYRARFGRLSLLLRPARGYAALYHRTVTQAPDGCDFDFLAGK